MMPDEIHDLFQGDLVFNGVNGITGEYGQPAMPSERLARLIQRQPTPEDYKAFVERQKYLAALSDLDDRLQRINEAQVELQETEERIRQAELEFKAQHQEAWPVKPGAGDPARVEDVGWGVIFPADMDGALQTAVKEALAPLLDLRQSQAGELFKIYEGPLGYRPGERKDQYFDRLGVGPGLADPQEMPFYLLLIGTPEEIPYKFQYQADVMRGVGRLDFGSDVEAYRDYADHVVAAETGEVNLSRRVGFFAPANPGDKATRLSSRYLVQPLYENLTVVSPEYELPLDYEWELLPPFMGTGEATHHQLRNLLGGDPGQTPALLFTASHGMEFPPGHPDQRKYQGALLCQDWSGPGGDIRRDYYFAGEDVARQADLTGMMAFFFACYGAGTPLLDQFAMQAFKVREKIAPRAFTGALPQRMLRQGALAVIGHVERAWGYSFVSPKGRLENQSFITAMRTLMNGDPIGLATDTSFNMRYAEMSSDLSSDLEELHWDKTYMTDYELAHRWTANNDARAYVVIGDPAARIPFAREDKAETEVPDLGTLGVMPEPGVAAEPEVASVEPEVASAEPAAVPIQPEAPAPEEPAAPDEVVGDAQAVVPEVSAQPARDIFVEEGAVAFGMGDQFDKLRASLRSFTDQLASSLAKAAKDIVSLDVRTYTTDDLVAASEALNEHQEVAAQLRALTRVAFDGDVDVYVPEEGGEIDEALWLVHTAMVEEAQASRAQFLATMAELATKLLESLKVGP
jgi:hypothetical protein